MVIAVWIVVLVVFEILDSGFSDLYGFVAILFDMIWTVFWVVVGIKEFLVVVLSKQVPFWGWRIRPPYCFAYLKWDLAGWWEGS